MPSTISTVAFPLVTTTASLGYAIFEILVFRGLTSAASSPSSTPSTSRSAVARTISLWWKTTYMQGLSLILTTGVSSLSAGILAIRSFDPITHSSERRLAIAGTAFAVGHFVFAPWVVPVIDGMAGVYDDEKTKSERERVEKCIALQTRWNSLHLIRTLVADLPALLCYLALALRDD